MTGWRPPLREPTAAPELTSEMTPQDIEWELKMLRFGNHSELRTVRVDQDVRDWLLTRLAARR